ncbi:MAG: hypothetical protein AB7E67_09140 [Xanthobacteraceae bacterium]
MWQRFVKLAFAAAALFAAAAPWPASACGSPPDPRTNTAGYASWCSCMGGSYNYQTTACTGATGPRRGGGQSSRSGYSFPAQHWYCRARARNGASGWARYADRGQAESEALSNCSQYSRGQACRIAGCSHVGGETAGGAAPSGVPAFGAQWYCRARASNGASGWGRAGSRSAAEANALGYCDQNARGSACRIVSCTANGQQVPVGSPSATTPAAAPEPQTPSATPPGFTPFRQPTATCGGRKCLAGQTCGPTNRCYNPNTHFYCGTTRCVKGRNYAANTACGKCSAPAQDRRASPNPPFPFGTQTCEQCYRKLKADIRFGWFSHRPHSYIGHAVTGYENCKRKAAGSCDNADRFRDAARGCATPGFTNDGSRTCIENVLTNDPASF